MLREVDSQEGTTRLEGRSSKTGKGLSSVKGRPPERSYRSQPSGREIRLKVQSVLFHVERTSQKHPAIGLPRLASKCAQQAYTIVLESLLPFRDQKRLGRQPRSPDACLVVHS
jgi:hypothetical protein